MMPTKIDKREGIENRTEGTPMKPRLPYYKGGDLLYRQPKPQNPATNPRLWSQYLESPEGRAKVGFATRQSQSLSDQNDVFKLNQQHQQRMNELQNKAASDRAATIAQQGELPPGAAAGTPKLSDIASRVSPMASGAMLSDIQRGVQSRMMGGASDSTIDATNAGRADAADILAKPKYPTSPGQKFSPLAGSADSFNQMNDARKAEDAEYTQGVREWIDKGKEDANENGVPDRDEAVASKFGSVGLNSVADLSRMSARYNIYLRGYRQDKDAVASQRPMSFDEFARNEQKAYQQRPVYGMPTPGNTSASGQPIREPVSDAYATAKASVIAQRERDKAQKLEERKQRLAVSPEMAIANQIRYNAIRQGASLQQASAIGLAALAQQLQGSRDLNMETLKQVGETERAGLAAQANMADDAAAMRNQQLQEAQLAMQIPNPASVAQDTYRQYIEDRINSPGFDPADMDKIKSEAEAASRSAYDDAMYKRSILAQNGVQTPEPPSMPSVFNYTPPQISPDLNAIPPSADAPTVGTIASEIIRTGGRLDGQSLKKALSDNGLAMRADDIYEIENAARNDPVLRQVYFLLTGRTTLPRGAVERAQARRKMFEQFNLPIDEQTKQEEVAYHDGAVGAGDGMY